MSFGKRSIRGKGSSGNSSKRLRLRAAVNQVPLEKIVGLARGNFASLAPRDVLHLQRIAGNRALVQVQPVRSSPEQKKEERARAVIVKNVDKKLRTRQGQQAKEMLGKNAEEIIREAGEVGEKDKAPTKLELTQRKLFSGNRNFDDKFRAEFWRAQPDPPACAKCGDEIKRKDRSIDHKESWSVISSYVPTFDVCKGGVHWTVSLDEDAQAVNRNLENLQPMHGDCNSSKSGSTDVDSLRPVRKKEICPGAGCGLEKAV